MLDDLQIAKRKVLKQIMDNPLFEEAVAEAKSDISKDLFATEELSKRESLYQEHVAMDRVIGRLRSFCNDITMLPKPEERK